MELIDAIHQIAKVFTDRKEFIQTEEATKTALIMPFISALGYNVFDPSEVVPEFTADIGTKKGEKVDYAILKNNEPVMLIEAKFTNEMLDASKESQLMRYFNVTPAKIGILTNGHEYKFYTDLDQNNMMDQMPFLQFSICDISEPIVKELKRFTKSAFKIEEIASTAEELKYTGAMKSYLQEQLTEPSEDFVEFMARKVFKGRYTGKTSEKFKIITKKAFTQFVSDRVSDRLATALSEEKAASSEQDNNKNSQDENKEAKNKIVTTQDEIDALNIVKAILRPFVDVKRIVIKDTINYCNILLDNNIRKILCRLYFNNPNNKYVGFYDTSRKEFKAPTPEIDDIYKHAEELERVLKFYLEPNLNINSKAEEDLNLNLNDENN